MKKFIALIMTLVFAFGVLLVFGQPVDAKKIKKHKKVWHKRIYKKWKHPLRLHKNLVHKKLKTKKPASEDNTDF